MKILLVGNHPQDGVNSLSMTIFADMLYSALRKRGHEVVLARPNAPLWELMGKGAFLGKWCKYVEQFVFFPFQLRRLERWAELVHVCDHSNTPLLEFLTGKPCLVTCHDVIGMRRALGLYQEERAGWLGRRLQAWTARNLCRADRVACVSQTVRRELEELLPSTRDRLSVVYNGLNYPYSPMDEMACGQMLADFGIQADRPFVLHVGSGEWKKNRQAVVETFAELRRLNHPCAGHLVFVGDPLSRTMKQHLQRLGLAGDVHCLGNVPGEVLRALYSKAALFLFPSLYEGFGWPIIEAQACGCLVATSNRDPMQEISGDGAIHIDPETPIGSARMIAGLPQAEFEAVRRRGQENVRRFSPEAMIEEYEDLYRTLLAPSKGSLVAPATAS